MLQAPKYWEVKRLVGKVAFDALKRLEKSIQNEHKRKRNSDVVSVCAKKCKIEQRQRRKHEQEKKKYETPPSGTGRSSTLRSGFYKEQAPIQPYETARANFPAYIALVGSMKHCMYCGVSVEYDPFALKGDHFYSAILNKRPRGYANDIFNRVPCCVKCNSSKASKLPLEFMLYTERLIMKPGHDERLERVKQFAYYGEPYRLKYDVTSPVMLELFDTLESLDFFTRTSLETQKDVATQLREVNQHVPGASEERTRRIQKIIAYVRQLLSNTL